MAAEYGKDVNENKLDNKNVLIKLPITVFTNHDMVPLVDEALIVPKRLLEGEITVLPIMDSSLLLKSKEEILFCDYMIY